MAAIEELDVTAAAGDGASVESADVVRTWLMPRDVVSVASDSGLDRIKIIRVKGDSMAPTYNPVDRILVDTGDTVPSPGGVFVVWDGLGLVVKRVQVKPHSEPITVRIFSDNPKYEPYERVLSEAYVQGRVIGKWLWT
jgi:phage repressor protein C with HTH and peptisase S24 domain